MENDMQKASNPIARIRNYLSMDSVRARFSEVLGEQSGAFINSIVNVVRSNKTLQGCSPDSLIGAALVSATFRLPIDPALGQAAIVPYGSAANFQLMYKGLIQLCLRTGQYARIDCSEVYADELRSYNPITGEVLFNDPASFEMRKEGDPANIVGHYAAFRLVTGFEKSDYMTTDEVMDHARRYSKAYQSDLKKNKKASFWSKNPVPMGNKTVLLRLLRKYGIMSVEMQKAVVADHEGFEASQDAADRVNNEDAGQTVIDAEFDDDAVPDSVPEWTE